MNSESRLVNSLRNTIFSILGQGMSILLSFAVRFVFIRCLPTEYLGLNGLFTSVLSILSLAELGVGTAIVYSMYKPIAEHDEEKICILMRLYAKVYSAIGAVVALLGVAISPFLGSLIKDMPDLPGLKGIYFIFLFDTVASYFLGYKRSLITADQRESVISVNHLLFMVIKSVVQIACLLLLKNFYVYLIIQVACTVGENIRVAHLVNKLYPFLKKYGKKARLPAQEKKTIVENVKALFIYKAASVLLGGIDNLIISAQIGVICVAMYSNYTLVVNSLSNVLNMVTTSVTASIGNFVATETKDAQKGLFEKVVFVVFLLFGFSSVCLCALLNPFVEIYCGKDLLLSNNTVIIIVLNFFIVGMMNPIWTFRSTMGLFIYGRWRPVISAIINFVFSLIFAKWWGIEGVLIATAISRITTNLWFDPYIVYKKGFGQSPKAYYLLFLKYALIVALAAAAVSGLGNLLGFSATVAGFVLRLLFVVALSGAIFLCVALLDPNRQYFLNAVKAFTQKFKGAR